MLLLETQPDKTADKERLQKFHTNDEILVERLIGRALREICLNLSEVLIAQTWLVTRHRHGILRHHFGCKPVVATQMLDVFSGYQNPCQKDKILNKILNNAAEKLVHAKAIGIACSRLRDSRARGIEKARTKTGGNFLFLFFAPRPHFCAPYTFASSPLSESLEQATIGMDHKNCE